MFRAGRFVATHVSPVAPDQVQPNGVDLTIGAIHEQVEPGRIDRDGKTVGERTPVEPDGGDDAGAVTGADADASADGDDAPSYRLEPGGYVCEYGERVAIPRGHVGFVYPRSSLMRNSCMLHTAVWDAGYEGRGEGLLVAHRPVELVAGARVAQLVLAAADHDGTYDGDYQGERV
jgi:deoxycytidine triphosphate deaminase